jgi:hypothetical protein
MPMVVQCSRQTYLSLLQEGDKTLGLKFCMKYFGVGRVGLVDKILSCMATFT